MAKKAKAESKRDGLGAAKARVAGYGLLEEADRLVDEYGKDEQKAWALKYAFYRIRSENKTYFAPKPMGKSGKAALTMSDKRSIKMAPESMREQLVKILLEGKGRLSKDEIKAALVKEVIQDAVKV